MSQIDVDTLEALLVDEAVTAIHLTEYSLVYEKAGETHTSNIQIERAHQHQIIELVVAACGKSLSADHSMVEGVLDDDTKIYTVYEPLSLSLYKQGSK
ncbi:MAG: hypothetical protein H6671_04000 [Anaerolineaceae bacterium]|nr:hypothetical protein [Anaerolineaceae bacterium]